MKTITRRSLVSAAPAALVAATVPAIAAEHPDAALIALRASYELTLAAMDVASKPHSIAENAYIDLKRMRPDLDARERRKISGLALAEPAWERAVADNHEVILQIAEQPAHSLEGLIFKARISDRESNGVPDLVDSIVADLVAMGGAHA